MRRRVRSAAFVCFCAGLGAGSTGRHGEPREEKVLSLTDAELYGSRGVMQRSATVRWQLPNFTKEATVHVLPRILSPQQAEELVSALPMAFNLDLDSVDSLPTYEFPLQAFNKPSLSEEERAGFETEAGSARSALRKLTAAPLQDVVLPYIREKYSCPDCIVCTQIFRRYRSEERLRHPAHFDTQAYITVVVSLSDFGSDFSGGLYVRHGDNSGRQNDEFIPLGIGDAAVHQFDLQHGVEIQPGGSRYSWIIWLQDGDTCSTAGKELWHREDAERGDPVAKFNMGTVVSSGSDPAKAHPWFLEAAEGGYAAAMYSAGVMYVQGPPGVEQNPVKGLKWLRAAAEHGEVHAMYNAGYLLLHPTSLSEAAPPPPEPAQDELDEGIRWWTTAANQGDAKSAYALGALYSQGASGITIDAVQADYWMLKASELGDANAMVHTAINFLNRGRDAAKAAAESTSDSRPKKRGRRAKRAQKAKLHKEGSVDGLSNEDINHGLSWLRKAELLGSQRAAKLLRQLQAID